MEEKDTCTTCFKIKCRQCGWEPNEEEDKQILAGNLTTCPICGWSPAQL